MQYSLVGEEFWAIVGKANTTHLEDIAANTQALKKWTTLNAKAEFVLSPTLFDHIIKCTSANNIWETLNRFFNKKNLGRLQMLENELANTEQSDLSISQFSLKIKNLCSEIRSN